VAQRAISVRYVHPERVRALQVLLQQRPSLVVGHSTQILSRHTGIISMPTRHDPGDPIGRPGFGWPVVGIEDGGQHDPHDVAPPS